MKIPNLLTERELSIFQDLEFMPLKAKVWAKIEALLSQLMEDLQELIPTYSEKLPEKLVNSTGKISRGENYKDYAYRVLDYPRLFEGKDFFTFRCVVLWGHPIGFHFILKGKYKEAFEKRLLENAIQSELDVWLSTQDDPWVWEKNAEGQTLVNQLKKIPTSDKDFLKLSVYLELSEYKYIPQTGKEFFIDLLSE